MSQEFTTTFWHFILGPKGTPQFTMLKIPQLCSSLSHRQLLSHLVLLRKQHLHLHVLSDSSAGPSPWRLTPTVPAAPVGSEAPSPDCKDAYKDLVSGFFSLSTNLSPHLPALTNILPDRISFLFFFLGTYLAALRLSCGIRDL